MNFDNLYNGDKFFGDATNIFLNENWRFVFNETKKSIFEVFSLIIENVMNNVSKKIPYENIFTGENWSNGYQRVEHFQLINE